MKRLREADNSASPELERLAGMLGQLPPLADDNERRRRVRLALPGPPRSPWRQWRVALVLALLLLAGVAGAAGRRWLRTAQVEGVATPSFTPSPGPARAPLGRAVEVVAPVTPPASAAAPAPSVSVAPNALPVRPAKRIAAATPQGDDPGTRLMVEAMQARTAGKYGRALELLGDYQRRFPRGALQDEALALQVEMTSLQGGAERARALGRAYLARFPNGRYRAWVSQSLDAAER